MKLISAMEACILLIVACSRVVSSAVLRGRGGRLFLAADAPEDPRVPSFPRPFRISDKRVPTGYWRVGCQHDIQTDQRRFYDEFVAKEDRESITPEVCWEFCRHVGGAQFFGLENGDRCYCTPFTKDDDDFAGEMCDMPCVGDNAQMCGNQRLQDVYQMHASGNVPDIVCERPPPPVPHAKVFKSQYYRGVPIICSNAKRDPLMANDNHRCTIECEAGYAAVENTIRCKERGNRLTYSWGQTTGSASCDPVKCGNLPEVNFAKSPRSEMFFPQTAEVQCILGYTLNATDPSDAQATIKCQTDASFSSIKDCVPVQCGAACPSKPEKYPNATAREQGKRVFKDTCTYDCEDGFTLDSRSDGGRQFEIDCMHTGEFSEPAKCRPVVCGTAPVVGNGKGIEEFPPDHKVVYPEAVKYECNEGYTTNTRAKGPTSVEVECKANGLFTQPGACKPVMVGNPPFVNNSVYVDRPYVYGESVTYTCDDGYTTTGEAGSPDMVTLHTGPDGQWAGSAPRCLPVVCGTVPSFKNSEVDEGAPRLVNFESDSVGFKCLPGYSTVLADDIWEPAHATFMITCQASGQFTTPHECVNINDCATRNCGIFGTCKDLPDPKGEPLDDYTCECLSGYEITLHNSTIKIGAQMKRSTNINDCPEDACGGRNRDERSRGQCIDEINEYDCLCGAGYEKTKKDGNFTCSPIECGKVSAGTHAVVKPSDVDGKVVNYDTESWTESCDMGYTHTGTANGAKNTEVSCTSTRAFSMTPSCHAVSCGAPKRVGHADMSPKSAELVYKENVVYTCDEGFALEGDPKGKRSFEVHCLAAGGLSYPTTKVGEGHVKAPEPTEAPGGQPKKASATVTTTTTQLSCLPVICGKLPDQDHASWNDTKKFVYAEKARVQCDEGYSTDGSTVDGKDVYKAHCMSDGSFSISSKCQKVKCLTIPEVGHSSHEPKEGPFVYRDEITYKMDPGYKIDVEGVDRIGGTFTCHCDSNGEFNGTCAEKNLDPKPISCGPMPKVENARVTGSTEFGGTLTATADEGYTLDGTAKGRKSFTFSCQANGKFSAKQEFERVECGICPEYDHVAKVEFKPASSGGSLLQKSTPSESLKDASYSDEVTYKCETGYRAASGGGTVNNPVAPIPVSKPTEFSLRCAATGDFGMLNSAGRDTNCVPVTCDVQITGKPEIPHLHARDEGRKRLQYQHKQDYICESGFSLDGKPNGGSEFKETCSDSGSMTAMNKCKDIDWCLDSHCGDNGKCQDGRLAYTCKCDAGYEATLVDAAYETCTQIDECETQRGNERCGTGGGECKDKTLGYDCKCADGYENVALSNGRDSCVAVLCPALPVRDNAASEMQGQKIAFPEEATYVCGPGFTTDGDIDGKGTYTLSCEADKSLGGLDATCDPVRCPDAPGVDNATSEEKAKLVYLETREYTCKEGHTTNGEAEGPSSFNISCGSNGELSAAQKCLPVSCGETPVVLSADEPDVHSVSYGQKVAYECLVGFSLNGEFEKGPTKFELACEANGSYTGQEICQPVSCGSLPDIPNAQFSLDEFHYMQTTSVACNAGYTIDADPDGEGNFVVRCGSDGFFKNPAECKPVSCGKPGSTSGATVPAEAKLYGEEATWTCKDGFSTDGSTSGGTEYVRHCEANGLFGKSSPTNCMDMDYCDTEPCGSSGSCKDLGVGVPAPGYKCTCYKGFEVRKRDSGGEYCHADDCAGDPCGEGGKCTDLSKLGGEQGQYSCECDSGYGLTQPNPGKYKCERKQCGPLPAVNHTKPIGDFAYSVKLWKDGEAMVDEFFGQQILQSFDVATFKCDRGYSTDQHTSPESKDFKVKCKADGTFSVDLRGEAAASMCLPIMCDEGYLPSITHADLSNSAPFVFEEHAEYKCHAGHTLNGKLDGEDNFKLMCKDNGKFSENKKQCFKITCSVPSKPLATAMSSGTAKYDKTVRYQCNYGHFTEGIPEDGRKFFEGTCGADGDMVFEGHSSCEPAKCPKTPDQLNVVSNDVSKSLVFQQRAFFQCKPGYTLGGFYGGSTDYLVNCQGDGALSGSFYNPVFERTVVGGPPEGAACVQSKLRIRGVVTDAEAGSKRLADALVTIKSEGTSKQVRTDSDGIYTVDLLAGDMTIEVDAVGYISRKKGPFDIQTSINPGQGMDIAVSKPLPDDAWRVVMSWNKEPADLDSHTYFGCGFQEHVSVGTGKRSISERAGGLDVSLDRDAAFGYGPETTTIRNAGHCSELGCCLVEFKVNHHGGSGSLADSGATVTLYKGATKFKKYTVPCTGDSRWWTVFTIDLTSSQNKPYEGDWARAPYISWGSTGRSDWSTSFDASRWSKADPPAGGRALIFGLEMKSETKLHHLDAAKYFTVQGPAASAPEGCQEVSWAGLLPKEEWAQCPSGYYLTGLYRSGNKYDELDGVEQLDKGYCCTEGHKSHAPAWGKCHVQKLGGGNSCEPLDDGTPTALVGLRGVKVAGAPAEAAATEGPNAKSATTGSGVFMGGYYIELGFRTNSLIGKMGTDDYPASWPHRQRGRGGVGMMANADSLYEGNPALTVDYFLPGSPEESFWIGVNGNYCNNCGSGVRDTTSETKPLASTVTTATYSGLEVTQKITLGWEDKYFKNTITVKNTGGGSLSRVRFMRSHDPDNTVDGRGSYRTEQHIDETFAAGGAAEAVSAKSRAGDAYYEVSGGQQAAVVYYTTDKRGRVSFGSSGLKPNGPYDSRVYDSPPSKGQGISQDAYISIAFDFGTLSAGQEETVVYFTALDNRPVTEVMAELTAASKEVLTLDEMKCCAVGIKGLVHGGETCSTE